jgi:hypothetical protein
MNDRPSVLDAIRGLEDEAAVGRHRGRISMMAESAPVGLVPELIAGLTHQQHLACVHWLLGKMG